MSAKNYIEKNQLDEAYEKWRTTNARWKNHWFETCLAIFEKSKDWAKKYIINPVTKLITKIGSSCGEVADKIIKARRSKYDAHVIWNCERNYFPVGTELFYLVRAMKGKNVIFSKVGTTTRTVEQRMREHLKYYKKLGCTDIIIDKVYPCRTVAEGYESFFRSHYIAKYPGTFKKNDRFFGVEFDLEEAERIFRNYEQTLDNEPSV